MKKKLFLLISVLILAMSLFALSSCFLNDDDDDDDKGGASAVTQYSLEGSIPDAVFGEELDLSSLYVKVVKGDTETNVPVTKDMITSGGTDKVGVNEVVFSYGGKSLTKTVTVKYRVTFMDGDTAVKTQYVTSKDELEPPVLFSTDTKTFKSWTPDVSAALTANTTFTAQYDYTVPALKKTYEAEYGTLLSEIQLASNAAGSWRFNVPYSIPVGDADGEYTFDVSFVADGKVIKTDTVKISVTKRTVEFLDLVTVFTYNGKRQIPTYSFGNFEIPEENVLFLNDGHSDYTSAGEYTYEFYIDDPNFEGYVTGTYVINKAPVTVNVNSYTISLVDKIPEIEYTVEGFEDISALGISVITPDTIEAGNTYELDAVATNPNVELTVKRGTLTVTSAKLSISDVGYPIISFGGKTYNFNNEEERNSVIEAVYEDSFEDLVFASNTYGVWAWEKTGSLGDASDTAYVYNAVFTPGDTRYDPITLEIPVKVEKKTLYFHFSNTTVTYNGSEQGLKYEIYENPVGSEDKGQRYEGLKVLGYRTYTNVNVDEHGAVTHYVISLSLDESNYTAAGEHNFTIEKANPNVDFSTVYSKVWSSTLYLSDITLPDGYSWVDGNTTNPEVSENGKQYAAVYTPSDTLNYNIINGSFTVKIAKATVNIIGTKESYEHTYSGEKFTLGTIDQSHSESVLQIEYYKNGVKTDPINAGDYDIVFTLPESDHYNEATASATLTIKKAKNTDFVEASRSAIFGDLVNSKLTLPSSDWKWYLNGAEVSADATVGDAGAHTYVAKYSDPNENYEDREVDVTVTVAKAIIKTPSAVNKETKYNGTKITSGLTDTDLYTVSDAGHEDFGTYEATLTLKYPENYAWDLVTNTSTTTKVSYKITTATNTWTTTFPAEAVSWTYLGTPYSFSAAANFGGNAKVTYYTAAGVYISDTVPTDAGDYIARHTVAGDGDNYGTIYRDVSFTINKKGLDAPGAKDKVSSFTYTGSEMTFYLDGSVDNTLYTVTGDKGTDVKSYTVRLTLTAAAKKNYYWNDFEGDTATVGFAITKAEIVIESVTMNGWTYGATASTPNAEYNLSDVADVDFTYYIINEDNTRTKLDARPTDAGNYVVVATVSGNDNYSGDTAEKTFSISKANASISATGTYTFTYNGEKVTLTSITGSHNEANVILTLNGTEFTAVSGAYTIDATDAGTYDVVASLAETKNYNSVALDIEVTIDKADNTDTVDTTQEATYGDLVKDKLTLPGADWSWYLDGVKVDTNSAVGNAGTYTYVAKYSDPNENYEDREVDVTVTVAKQTVPVPTIPNYTYDGKEYVPTVSGENFTVTENLGGTDKGTYEVKLKLNNFTNFEWEDYPDDEEITITYKISETANNWTKGPSVTGCTFGGTPTVEAEATSGDVKIEYAPYGTTDFSETVPTDAGTYSVRFTTTDENYEILTKTLTLVISPKEVDVPDLDYGELKSFVYNNTVQKPTVALNGDAYTVVFENENSKEAGTYKVTITLNSNGNYVWTGGASDVKEPTYEIEKADASLTASITGWTYGEYDAEANAPSYTAVYDREGIYFLYAVKGSTEFTKTVPTTAGDYVVKAVYDAEGDKNIKASESALKEFTIAKASSSINGVNADKSYTAEYTGSAYTIPGITASNTEGTLSYAYYNEDGEKITSIVNVGKYTAVISLSESTNYNAATDVEVDIEITKKVNTDTFETITATFGEVLSDVDILLTQSNATGSWAWQTPTDLVGNASASGNAHVAKFTPYDEYKDNYDERTATIYVVVEKQVISTPTVPDANKSQYYTGSALTVGIADKADVYTVSGGSQTNVGTHTVTITLTHPENYAWNSLTNESATVTVQFTIKQSTNSWKEGPTFSGNGSWAFGDTAQTIVATPAFGNVNVSYLVDGTTYSATMPTSPGNHKAVVSVTGNNNYTSLTAVELPFEITVRTITKPTLKTNTFVYTGAVITPEIIGDVSFCNVTYNKGSDVGTSYSVTVTPKDNCTWTDGTTEAVVLTYSITKGQAVISGFTASNWIYNKPTYPTASANFGTVVFTCYDKDGNELCTFYYDASGNVVVNEGGTLPKAAGTYSVKASVAADTDADGNVRNYDGAETEAKSFVISKATPTLSGYDSVANATYENLVVLNTGALSATGAGAEAVNGTFTYSAITFVESTTANPKASYVTLSFKPTDTANYNDTVLTINMALKTVAKLNNTTAYGSIEKALAAANSGDTVWVMPDKTGNVKIMSDVTIKSGVTLVITHGTDDTARNLFADDGKIYATLTSSSYKGLESLKKLSSVKLAAGKTITNHGTIEISGELSAPGGGVNYTGHTARNYAELVLGENAKIVSKADSKIISCGFIHEESLDNGSSVTVENGASIYQPFVIRDWRGGSYMSFIYNNIMDGKASAFNMFQVMNVSAFITVQNGGSLKGIINIYAGDKMNAEVGTIVGTGSDAIIQLTTDKSYFTAKYNLTTQICDVNIYGGAQTNGLNISVDTGTLGVKEANTNVTFFPISYFFDITLNDNGNNSVYYMNQAFKILTGGKLTIGENVTVIAKKILAYEEFTDDCVIPGKYPTGLPAAEINLYGTLVIETLGGIVTSKSDNAKLIVTSSLSALAYESTTYKTVFGANIGMNKKDVKFSAKLKDISGTVIDLTADGYGVGGYTAASGQWKHMYLIFDSVGGSEASQVHIQSLKYPTLPTPTRDGYSFLGWYYGDTPVSSADALLVYDEHTLTAKWGTVVKVTLNADNGTSSTTVVISSETEELLYSGLTNPTKANHSFLGWYYGDTPVTNGTALTTKEDHTLVAKWRAHTVITLDANGGTASSDAVYVDTEATDKYPTLPTPTKDGYSFLGWFVGENKYESGETMYSLNAHTLTAQWKSLIPITLNTDGGECSSSAVYYDSDGPYVYPTLPTPSKEGYAFIGWFFGDTMVNEGDEFDPNSVTELVAHWQKLYKITVSTSSATVSGVSNNQWVEAGTELSLTISYNKSWNRSFTVTNSVTGEVLYSGDDVKSYLLTMPEYDITITAESSGWW